MVEKEGKKSKTIIRVSFGFYSVLLGVLVGIGSGSIALAAAAAMFAYPVLSYLNTASGAP